MLKESIMLRSISDILKFYKDITNLSGDTRFVIGKVEISAKSIMNIFTLDLNSDLCLVYYGEDKEGFMRVVNNYRI